MYRQDGRRVRQEVTVQLLEHVDPLLGTVAISAAKRTRDRKGKARPREPYVVREGDTLERIALRELGDRSRWRDIARLNKIRDPSRLKRGRRLKMP